MSWLYERNRRGMQGAVNSNFKRHCVRVVDRTIVGEITFEGFSGFFFRQPSNYIYVPYSAIMNVEQIFFIETHFL